jgi:hypothetical protein
MPAWQASAARNTGTAKAAPRSLTETHAEIEERRELELAQQHPMRRLGRDMRRQGMIERIAAQLRQRRDRRG